jgi:cytochrome c5
MRRFLPFLLLFLTGAAHAAPRIVFDKTEFDFGVLIQGATAQHDFSFQNLGEDPLEIQALNSSCGCTAALATEKIIPPGGKSSIRVTYDSHGKVGEVQKNVRVQTNDPQSPVIQLVIRGLVMMSAHPEMTGTRNLFQGNCKTCHADRGAGKKGKELYAANCAMCHEHHKMGGKFIAPAAEDMAGLPAADVAKVISVGRPGTSMPAFHTDHEGPLSEKQIKK